MATAARTRVVLLGCGGVGRSLLELLLQPAASAAFSVAGVADSLHLLVSTEESLSPAALRAVLAAKAGRLSLASVAADGALGCAAQPRSDAALLRLAAARTLFADCSAADTAQLHLAALAAGSGVVLANKRPLADGTASDVAQLLAGRLRAESTVGAGLPVHAALRRLLRSGDAVRSVAGCFSGTLGVVATGLQAGQPFSHVVAQARERGYTEPDPRDDLSGLDVARKALILARLLGWELELKDVSVEPLFPPALAVDALPSVDAFLARLPELDEAMAARAAAAALAGCTLRYVARVEGGACCVGLTAVPLDSPLGRLSSTDNLVEVWSEVYDESPLVIVGRGAGARATAAGVLADCWELRELA